MSELLKTNILLEKKNVYNFNSLDTMRYQGYYLEITNGIPNTLYCEFYEDH